MIGISRLLGGKEKYGDKLRYSKDSKQQYHGTRKNKGPVVVWNMTRTCNLSCIHCYSNSEKKKYSGELSTAEAKKFIDDLAEFNVPVLLFSGGEPLIREDILQILEYTVGKGIRATISTNGTLITKDIASKLKDIGVGYVGISLDGMELTNDRFRGKKGAFKLALEGIRNCLEIGQKVGLRFTINRHNYQEINDIFDMIEKEKISRVCFYHLVYSGRGSDIVKDDISLEETREVLDLIIDRTIDFQERGLDKEILTVANHADGIYLYLKMKERDPAKAEEILELLDRNGGNRTGIAIANVDWEGNVHPDQFTQNHSFGNVKKRKFKDIWTDSSENDILTALKDRKSLLKGRCSNCKWLNICNGNFRARAEAIHGDFWHEDPACYLRDNEIGLADSLKEA
ncbi:putative heme d1 biosynthesis radical SAM protein NirJ1 [Natronospora cellulosivora (SeqCode)]